MREFQALLSILVTLYMTLSPNPSIAASFEEKQLVIMAALTPEQVEKTIKIKDDEFEIVATLSTENSYQPKFGFLQTVSNDNFIRAHIDKKTGDVSYQLYQWVNYSGEWWFFSTVNYLTSEGPLSQVVTSIDRSLLSCGGANGCDYREDIAFNLAPKIISEIFSSFVPGRPSPIFKMKFSGKLENAFFDSISAAEIVGAIRAVATYKILHKLP
jgi:hypothetical protein